MRIAITGGIGSGKSYVCRLLQQRGIEVFNCDIIAKTIIATHPAVRDELCALVFAEGSASGTEQAPMEHAPSEHALTKQKPTEHALSEHVLTKQALGDYIRRGPDYAARVNAIVHPRVAEAFVGSGMTWMECAILFESGFDRLVDRVVVVTCPEAERIRRIIARDHCDAATAHRWLALQMTDEERLLRAGAHNTEVHITGAHNTEAPNAEASAAEAFHIVNDGTTPLEPQLDALLAALN